MAIIFISPKKKQRIFFWAIGASSVVFLAVVGIVVFLPELLNKPPKIPVDSLYVPTINIDSAILDSPALANLQVLTPLPAQFSYSAQNSAGKPVEGTLSADNVQQAQQILESQDLKVISLVQMGVGRSNPFVPY